MGVGWRRGTRPILDDHAPHTLAGDVGNGTVEHHRHLTGGGSAADAALIESAANAAAISNRVTMGLLLDW